jgi:hypothetical protein
MVALRQFSVRRASMRSLCALPLLASLVVICAGCQSGSISAVVPVAGGGHINVPMRAGGPPPAEGDGFRVDRATIAPAKDTRELRYDFALVAANQPDLRRIQIDDISDETAVTWIDDANPQFKERRWAASTEMIPAEDPRLKWMFQITPSLRVFRFTLTHADGRKTTLDQVSTFPPFVKQAIRAAWGEKY